MIVDLTEQPFTLLSLYLPTTAEYKHIEFKYAYTAYIASQCLNDEDLNKFVDLIPMDALKLIRTVEINEDFDSIRENVLNEIFTNRLNSNNFVKQTLKDTCLEPIYNFDERDLKLGICKKTFEGENLVGKVWEKIRKETFYNV